MNTIKTGLIVIDRQFHYTWSGPPLVALIVTDSISRLVKSAIHIILHFILQITTVTLYEKSYVTMWNCKIPYLCLPLVFRILCLPC